RGWTPAGGASGGAAVPEPVERSANHGVSSESATARAATAGSGDHETLGSSRASGPPSSAPTESRNGAVTATKSQSKSTSECSTYATASTASATAAGPPPRTRRDTPPAAATIPASAKNSPTSPVSLRNCSG